MKVLDKVQLDDLRHCLDILLDISEECYPKHSSDDNIAFVLDIYKDLFD